MGKIKD